MNKPFEPKLVSLFKEGYSLKSLRSDVMAGIIVGIVALPLSIAFAIASGVKPEQGLITAVIAGFLIAVFSGSRVQIGGPTGAFIVIVYDIVQKYGYDGLATATLMAGVLLIILGIAKMGDVIKFIPYPVTIGFTSGIAVIIFTSQVRDFLGLHLATTPERFLGKWIAYAQNINTLDWHTLLIGIVTILIIVFWRKVTDRLPGPLIAILATTAIAHFCHWPLETIGSRFGHVANTIPAPHLPAFSWEIIVKMSSPALTIALLAGIESLLSAVVADGMTGRRHRSNMELIAQGIANIASPLFGGIPATGAIARTATNIKNGGLTPVAGIVHALTILVLFLFLGPWAALIPMATLAGILITVAYTMSEASIFAKLMHSPKSDVMVLLVTFLLTVLVDLTVAIEVGMVLAAFLFMKRMVDVTKIDYLNESLSDEENPDDPESVLRQQIPEGVEIFEINGPFFFGAADKFKQALSQLKRRPKVLILRMRHVPTMDATGLRALEDLIHTTRKQGTTIIIAGLHVQPFNVLKDGGIIHLIGPKNLQKNLPCALERAQELLP